MKTEQKIMDALRVAGRPLTPMELASILGVSYRTAYAALMRLHRKGLVRRVGRRPAQGRGLPPSEYAPTADPATEVVAEFSRVAPTRPKLVAAVRRLLQDHHLVDLVLSK